MTWDLQTQYEVGLACMAIGTFALLLIGIWAMREWYERPTWPDVVAFTSLTLIVTGVGMLAWAIRLY